MNDLAPHPPSPATDAPAARPRFEAVLFDLGDTLIDFDPIDAKAVFREAGDALHAELTAAGHRLPPPDRYRAAHRRAFYRAFAWSYVRRRDFDTSKLLARVAGRMGLPSDDASADAMAWKWYRPILARSHVDPTLLPSLAALRDAGVRMGVVSNTVLSGRVLDAHMDHFGLLEFFPVRVYSCNTRVRKPHPLIFQTALSRLGADPRRTLFVGDRINKDIRGAARLGMTTALRPRRNARLAGHGADYLIRQIAELVPVVVGGNDER